MQISFKFCFYLAGLSYIMLILLKFIFIESAVNVAAEVSRLVLIFYATTLLEIMPTRRVQGNYSVAGYNYVV